MMLSAIGRRVRLFLLGFAVWAIASPAGLAAGPRADQVERAFVHPQSGFSHAVTVEAAGVKTIYTSGQVGQGDDLRGQIRSSFEQLEARLAAAGATLGDIVKMTTNIVDYEPADLDIFRQVRADRMGNERMPAHTLVGVETLAVPGDLVEIEAIAVVAVREAEPLER